VVTADLDGGGGVTEARRQAEHDHRQRLKARTAAGQEGYSAPQVTADYLVTVEEAAAILASSVGSIRRWIRIGTLTAVWVGHRNYRLARSELERFISGGGSRS